MRHFINVRLFLIIITLLICANSLSKITFLDTISGEYSN